MACLYVDGNSYGPGQNVLARGAWAFSFLKVCSFVEAFLEPGERWKAQFCVPDSIPGFDTACDVDSPAYEGPDGWELLQCPYCIAFYCIASGEECACDP